MWETIPMKTGSSELSRWHIAVAHPPLYIHITYTWTHQPLISTQSIGRVLVWLTTPDFDSCHRLEVVNNMSRRPPTSIITAQYLTLENWQKAYGLCWLRLQPGQQKTFSAPTSIPLQHMNPVNLLWVHRSLWPPPSFPSSKLPPSLGTIPHLVSAFFPPTTLLLLLSPVVIC